MASSLPTRSGHLVADDGGDLGAHRQGAGSHGRGLEFLAWLYAQGDKMADKPDDVQMPDKLVDDLQRMCQPRSWLAAVSRCSSSANNETLRDKRCRQALFPVGG